MPRVPWTRPQVAASALVKGSVIRGLKPLLLESLRPQAVFNQALVSVLR